MPWPTESQGFIMPLPIPSKANTIKKSGNLISDVQPNQIKTTVELLSKYKVLLKPLFMVSTSFNTFWLSSFTQKTINKSNEMK